MNLRHALVVVLVVATSPPSALAQSPAVGDTASALPGIHRVGTIVEAPRGAAVAATAGYGFTESVLGTSDSHHRVLGSVAASLRPIDWLAFALELDGRYDSHSSVDAMGGSDDGFVGDPRLYVRAGSVLGGGLGLGLELGVWFPGDSAPSLVFEATTLDAVALATYSASGVTFGARAGFRFDQSGKSAPNADQLSAADRLSLGVSDSNAILLGLGLGYSLGTLELLGEATWDVLVGGESPGATKSPLRIAAGARFWASDSVALRFMLEASASGRPSVAMGEPLAPIEPRFAALVGVSFRFPFDHAATTATGTGGAQGTGGEGGEGGGETRPRATTGVLRGVVTAEGNPVAGATVHAGTGDAAHEVESGSDGHFEIAELPPGELQVQVTADGFEAGTRTTTIRAGATAELEITLERALPAGQLRGVVRSFDGTGLAATIRVEPLGRDVTASSDGTFQVDVPPGQYQIVISAPGHEAQRRSVSVEQQGVTVLNVDMRRSR